MFAHRTYLLFVALLLIVAACSSNTLPAVITPSTAEVTNDMPQPNTAATELPPPPVITTQAEPETMPTATQLATEIGFEYEGIYLDPGGLGNIVVSQIPQQMSPNHGTHPDFTVFHFDGYPLENTLQQPGISIYPAADFASLSPSIKERFESLQQLLTEKPANLREQELPHLTIFNAAQVLRVQTKYVSFNNGQGVRFITYYAQAADPISNHGLFYSFQGFTNDGAYFVSAMFPVGSPTLPQQPPIIEDYDAFIANLEGYVEGIATGLNGLAADQFLPTLTALDQMIASLEVAPPVAMVAANQLVITHPPVHSQLAWGEIVTVRGQTPDSTTPIEIAIQAAASTLISTTVQTTNSGTWSADLPIPNTIQGTGLLIVNQGNAQAVQPLVLYVPESADLLISLDTPHEAQAAVEGHPLFFHGTLTSSPNETVTIGVLTNNCQEFMARQSFELSNGTWRGTIILPRDTIGPACAIAYTGEYDENWRGVMQPLEIYGRADEAAPRITIGNMPNLSATAGESLVIYGAAVNPTDGELSVILANSVGQPVTEAAVMVDAFGYWEVTLTVPADYAEPEITVIPFFETDKQRYEAQRLITIR